MLFDYFGACDILKQISQVTSMLDMQGQENQILWNQVYCNYTTGDLKQTSDERRLFQLLTIEK